MKWASIGAVAVTLVSLYPQILLCSARGREWNKSFAEVHGDEWLYSAYVQALIDGRPRLNDPYTGRDQRPNYPQPESLFSIQFVPAYMIALPSRLLSITASTAFMILGLLGAFLAYFSIFWVILILTSDHRLAAAGAVIVICFGGLAAGEGLIHLLSSGYQYSYLPFLRRYEPLATFPLFFALCGFVWKSLNASRSAGIAWALTAGLAVDVLIFSYFYLWTAAIAWVLCLAILWLFARREDFGPSILRFGIVILVTIAGLIPYLVLLSRRSPTMDSGTKLTLSRMPDLLRAPEIIGGAIIAAIVLASFKGKVNWRSREILFVLSFALLPFVVFNQQVLTGRSLQPYHYELFVANYAVLVGLVVAVILIYRGVGPAIRPMPYEKALKAAFVAVAWGTMEVVTPTKVILRDSLFADRAAVVGHYLRGVAVSDGTLQATNEGDNPRPLVLATHNKVALILPTFAPQAVLWAPHFDFLHLQPGESRKRFYKYLYYTGFDSETFAGELSKPFNTIAAAAFGHERVLPDLAVGPKPITSEEIKSQVEEYEAYVRSFTREVANEHVLQYVVVASDGRFNPVNLDRWYERDAGEKVGDYILYRVRVRNF